MYGPNLTEKAAVAVRRIAWALDTNMGKAIEMLVTLFPTLIDAGKICIACKDRSKCSACVFMGIQVPPPNFLESLK